MKYVILTIALGTLLAGCAVEAPYTDREFGMATQDAFDRQIVNKDAPYGDKGVDGIPAIHAEKIMGTYHNTFSDSFSRQNIDITARGE